MDKTIKKWTPIVSRRQTVIRVFAIGEASMTTTKDYTGVSAGFLTINSAELADVYLNTNDTKQLSANLIARVKNYAEFPKKHAEDCRVGSELFVARSIDIARTATTENLAGSFKRYYWAYVEFAKFMIIPVAIERALTAKINTALVEKVGEALAQTFLTKLMTPTDFSEFQKEQIGLLRISLLDLSSQENALENHFQEFSWLSCYNIDEAPYSKVYFKERLEGILNESLELRQKQYAELSEQIANDHEVYRTTLAELALNDQLTGTIELLRQYVYLRTFRVEMMSKANYYIQPLFKKIAAALFLSLRQVVALTPSELVLALETGQTPETGELEKRCRDFGFRHDENGVCFVSGPDQTTALALAELGVEEIYESSEVAGTIAYAGTATGIVRVVITKQDIVDFKQGEILVTTMTTPEFVPAMKKAAAIVTNEGGVLCHAAIVARELKVPCVIGTHVATKIFRTGDVVKVDGEKGVAKKIPV